MPVSTLVKTRVKHKHDTQANWEISDIVPMLGELIVYDPDDTFSSPRIKIGDGVNLAKDLKFTASEMEVDYSLLEFDTSEIVDGGEAWDTTEVDYELLKFDTFELVTAEN